MYRALFSQFPRRTCNINALKYNVCLCVFVLGLQSERHFIMQVVCEATQSSDTNVRVAALQCLVKIMSLYYQYMEHYMGPALFAVSTGCLRSLRNFCRCLLTIQDFTC